ncbi:TonB-dependent receptor [Elongatibacter sediminis]|uniref:TonB-dependent receptor n=1 Tax=Elongatibacter sediminis TaxID=3119006 RepID=A0AAW9R8K2_9GAMM
MLRSKFNWAIALALPMTVLGGPVEAQQSASGSSALEEIVVTARRREENLQEVPVSIQAFSGNELEMRGLERVEDVVAAAPNVMVSASTNTALSTFAMRGIPRAGFFIDDVWQQSNVSLAQQSVLELDRVEILRGPQGTLYGRDTTGGAIRLYTKLPNEEFGVRANATIGNYNRRDLSLFADLPISDTLLSKISVSSATRDGYVDSIVIDRSFGDLDDQTIRGDLLWRPSDKFSARLQIGDTQFEGSGAQVIRAIYDPGEPGLDPGYRDPVDPGRTIFWVPNSQYYAVVGVPFNCHTDCMDYPGGLVGDLENRSPHAGPGILLDMQHANLDINWDITDNISMRSLTNYHDQWTWDYSNFVPSTVQFFTQGDIRERSGWTQEFQFSGEHDRISWVVGLYGWEEKTERHFMRWALWEFATGELDFADVTNSAACQSWDPSSGLAPCIQVPPSQDSLFRSQEEGFAIFGEVTFDVTDQFSVTVGARYHDQENREWNGTFGANTARRPDVPGTLPGGDALGDITWINPLENDFNQDTYRLAASYDWTDSVMTYFGFSQGYNAGGVSRIQIFDLDNNAIAFDFPYEPEQIDNYELGLRSDWLDGSLRFNATLFFTEWDQIQIQGTVTNPFTGVVLPTFLTSNAATAEAKGAEIEVTWVPNDNWQFDLDLGFLDTEYTDIAEGSELSLDAQFGMAPEVQYSLGGQYNGVLGERTDYSLRLDYMWTDGYNRTYIPGDWSTRYTGGKYEQPSFGLLNARLTFYPADNWEVAVFGTNLTDERYVDGGFMSPLLQVDDATVGRPREYGVTVRFEWQ